MKAVFVGLLSVLQERDSEEFTVEQIYSLLTKRLSGINKNDLDKRKLYSLVKVMCTLGFLVRVNKGLVIYNGLEESKEII